MKAHVTLHSGVPADAAVPPRPLPQLPHPTCAWAPQTSCRSPAPRTLPCRKLAIPWTAGTHVSRISKDMPERDTENGILFRHCLQLKLWEFKINVLARELLIDTGKSFNLQEKKNPSQITKHTQAPILQPPAPCPCAHAASPPSANSPERARAPQGLPSAVPRRRGTRRCTAPPHL